MKKLSVKALALLAVCAVLVVVLSVLVIVTAAAKDENRLVYELSEDETYYTVTDIKNAYRAGWFCRDSLTVPATHKGKPVKVVARIASNQLKQVTLSEGIERIGQSAFNENEALENIVIPDSVVSIGTSAFKACLSLKSISIGKNVESIGEEAFSSCKGLEEIDISEENVHFEFVNNCIINKETKTLMFGGNNATIPTDGSVTKIDAAAFHYNTTIKTLIIPECIVEIGNLAFAECPNLESVIWNATRCEKAGNTDGNQIFGKCVNLKTFTVGANVTLIPAYTLADMTSDKIGLTTLTFLDAKGWYQSSKKDALPSETTKYLDFSDPATSLEKFRSTNFLIKAGTSEQ